MKPAVEKMKNEQKEDGQEITFTCEFKGEGKVNAKFVFGEEEYKVLCISVLANQVLHCLA